MIDQIRVNSALGILDNFCWNMFIQVVERAVCAAGCLDDTWEKRLSRGKQLAQEVESRRRSKRDAQRAMEDKKAAELERHREEMRARAPARQRSFEVNELLGEGKSA